MRVLIPKVKRIAFLPVQEWCSITIKMKNIHTSMIFNFHIILRCVDHNALALMLLLNEYLCHTIVIPEKNQVQSFSSQICSE